MASFQAQHERCIYSMTTGSSCSYTNSPQMLSENTSSQSVLPNQSSAVHISDLEREVADRPIRRVRVPPEQREQLRRLKKQDMERRRRACISDKMNALHDLAMRVIGVEPSGQHRLEKADILGTCYAVLEGVAKLASDDSALRSRLHGLRSHIQDRDMSRDITMPDEATQSSTASGESLQTESLGTNKENQMHEQPNTPCHLQDSIATRFPWSLTSTPRSPLVPCPMTVTQAAPGSSLHDSGFHSSQEASMTTKFGSSFRSPLASLSVSPYMSNEMLREAIQVSNSRAVPSSTHISAFKPIRPAKIKTTHVWRPYLD